MSLPRGIVASRRWIASVAAVALCAFATIAMASLVADVEFRDGLESSEPPIHADGFEPAALSGPIADAGPDRNVAVGDPQVLDGSGSQDPDGTPLRYRWALASQPEGSQATLRDATTAFPALVPDVAGAYWIELVVDNGEQQSAPDRLRVRAFNNFGIDSDGDSLSDALERSLGLDPFEEDSFGDGIRDADRDLDADGLTIRQELLIGTDPINPDTDGNGINDGNEDFDRDGLSNRLEFQFGSNPLSPDTDGDGWPDGAEVDGGSDPASAASTPRYLGVASPNQGHLLVRPGTGDAGSLSLNPIIADPNQGHLLVRPGTGDAGSLPLNPIIADPNQGHVLVRPGTGDAGSLPLNPVVAQPPVTIQRSQ